MDPNVNQPEPPRAVAPEKDPVSLVFECAVESFVEAWTALIWGGIIFDRVGGIVGDMVPSLPPGMGDAPAPKKHPAKHGHSGGGWFGMEDHRVWIIFAVFFILNLRARMMGPSLNGAKRETRAHRVMRRFREEGFSLFFTNAMGAMVAAWTASLVTNFSWTQMCLHWVFDAMAPTLNQWSNALFGHEQAGAVGDWWKWWGSNQLKFSFWLFYITAICDDLGIPNFKTLARFFWRRVRHRFAAPVPSAGREAV